MSSQTSLQTTGTGPSTGDSSNPASTGAKKTAAQLVAALQKAKAAKAAAQAAADKAAADAQAADSCAAAWKISAARDNARAAAQTAAESRAAAKLVLQQQRITEAAAARAAAAAEAKAERDAAYKADHKTWEEKLKNTRLELDACTNGTGSYFEYHEAILYARVGPEFDKLCSECESSDKGVADAAKNLKQLVDEYKDVLAEKAKAVEKLKEPEHPDVVFKREFAIFIKCSPKLMTVISSLLEGRAVSSMNFVAAGFDPNILGMFGGLFSLCSVNDAVKLNPIQLHPYDRLKDKSNSGRDVFHLWCLQHTIFGFIQNHLVPLVDPSSGLTLEVLMLNYKYLLPKHIPNRDAQIAEHSANIQATVEFHRQRKEQKRCKNREATPQEFAEYERECEEHSQKEAAKAEEMRKLVDRVKAFIQDPENATLQSNLKSLGIQDSEATWSNNTAKTHALAQFLAANGLATFCDAIRFLQEAGIIDDERSVIPTQKNPTRQAFAFIFGKDTQSSSDSEDENVGPEPVSEKKEKSSNKTLPNKTLRIIRGDDDFILASAIREANHEKQHLDSNESSKEEESSAKEPTDAELPPSPPAPVFPERQNFFLSPEDAKTIASEYGLKSATTVSLVVMMKGVQSISAASGPDVINTAKHIEARIAAEEKAAEEKAARKAAEEFKTSEREIKRSTLLQRLAKLRSELNSGSVGGGASASADVVPLIEEDHRLTLLELTSQNGKVIERECGGLFSSLRAAASNNEGQPIAEQSANQNE